MMDELREVAVDLIDVDEVNPRREPGDIGELAASIADIGVLNPLILRPLAGGRYGALSGSRRLAAARSVPLDTVPAIVKHPADDGQALAIATAENVGRRAMNPIEEARAFRDLIDKLGVTQRDLGPIVGVSEFTVSVRLQLLELPDDVQAQLEAGELSINAAYNQLKRQRRGDVAPTRRRRRTGTAWMPDLLDQDLEQRIVATARRLSEEPGQLIARAIRRELRDTWCQRCEQRPALKGIGRPTTCGVCRTHPRKAAS